MQSPTQHGPSEKLAVHLAKQIISISFLCWFVLSALLLFFEFNRIDVELKKRVDEIVRAHRGIVEIAVYNFDYPQIKRVANDLLTYGIIEQVEIASLDAVMASAEKTGDGQKFQALQSTRGISVYRAILNAPEGSAKSEQIGQLRLIVSSATAMHDFYNRTLWLLLLGLTLNGMVTAAIIWAVHHSLTKPLLQYTAALQQVYTNNPQPFAVQLPPHIMRTELGDAVNATERLLGTVQQSIQHLEMVELALNSANETLEQKIRQRTESLAQANDELTRTYERLSTAQSNLHEADKLAAVGRLAAGVAHEINNPIAIVRGNLTALRTYVHDMIDVMQHYGRAIDAADPIAALKAVQLLEQNLGMDFVIEDIRNMLRDMEDSVIRISDIIKDLKGYSRVDAPNIDRISLDSCVQQVVAIASQIEHNPIDWQLQLGDTPAIECYPAQINDLLMQLLRNAVQALAGDGGQIVITTEVIDKRIYLSIRDNGIGISAENLPRIFEPFFTTRPVGQGRGLGLTRARSIVESHGGDINVQSIEGQGCTVRLSFPLATSLQKADSASNAA